MARARLVWGHDLTAWLTSHQFRRPHLPRQGDPNCLDSLAFLPRGLLGFNRPLPIWQTSSLCAFRKTFDLCPRHKHDRSFWKLKVHKHRPMGCSQPRDTFATPIGFPIRMLINVGTVLWFRRIFTKSSPVVSGVGLKIVYGGYIHTNCFLMCMNFGINFDNIHHPSVYSFQILNVIICVHIYIYKYISFNV